MRCFCRDEVTNIFGLVQPMNLECNQIGSLQLSYQTFYCICGSVTLSHQITPIINPKGQVIFLTRVVYGVEE